MAQWIDRFATVGKPCGIRTWLFALALSALLPLLLFAGIAAQRVASVERQATLADLEHRTEAAADAVERLQGSVQELAVTLANSPSALTGDLQTFYAFAKRAMEAGNVARAIAWADPDGMMLINTRRPFGEALPAAGDLEGVRAALLRKTPYVGNLFKGAVSAVHVFTVWVPVIREGQVSALVGVTVEPRDLDAVLREERLPEGWIGAVIDRDGKIAARNKDPETFVGRTATPELRASIARGQSGVFPSVTADGTPVSTSFRKLPNSGWAVAVGVPARLIEAPARDSFRFMLGLGLASLLAAGALAFLVGRQMSQQVAGIARAAQAVGSGQMPTIDQPSVREFGAVSQALLAARELIDTREAALRDSEARFRGIIEGSIQGIVMQRDGRILYANPAMARIFGYPDSNTMHGLSSTDAFVAEEERPALRARTAAAHSGAQLEPHPGWRGFRRDGTEIWLTTMAHRIIWQGQPAVASFYLDITDRKRTELQLLEAKRLTAIACEAGRMGTWHVDYGTNRVDLSDEMLALLGIERHQWGGTQEAFEALVHPDDVASRHRNRALAMATGPVFAHDFRVRQPNGEIHWLHSRGSIIRDPRGKAIQSVGVMFDITERKRAEEHQAMLIRELDHRVKNVLALVETIIPRSREGVTTLDEYMGALMGRLEALSEAHSAMSQGGWRGGDLAKLVGQELRPYATGTNTTVDGPHVVLTPEATQALVLVLVPHELSTNAAKYGALTPSTPDGRVSVRWQRLADAKPGPLLVIDWQESGGPRVTMPDRKGYGSSVIRELVPYELVGSTVAVDFAPDGLRCRIAIPVAEAESRSQPAGLPAMPAEDRADA